MLCGPTNAILDVGRYPSGVDDTADRLAALLDGSPRLLSEADDDVMTKKYGKLLINLGNIADAACGIAGRGRACDRCRDRGGQAGVRGGRHPLGAVARIVSRNTRRAPRRCVSTFRKATRSRWIDVAEPRQGSDLDRDRLLQRRGHHARPPPRCADTHQRVPAALRGATVARRGRAGSVTPEELDAEWEASTR